MFPENFVRCYTHKRDIILKHFDAGAVCFCRNETGEARFSGLNVVPIPQQRNGSDCGVFASAFETALVHGVPPSLLEFDTTKLRNHLCKRLKAGKLEMFPLLLV